MPELPEVETICRELDRLLAGARIGAVEILAPGILRGVEPSLLEALRGRVIGRVRRRGKLVILELGPQLLVIHLKMTGQPVVLRERLPGKHCRLIIGGLDAAGKKFFLHYNDIRRFGRIYLLPVEGAGLRHPLAPLGPDALELDAAGLAGRLGRGRGPVKSALLDQARLAGVGNIYADEILHRSRIHPRTPCRDLSPDRIGVLHESTLCVLNDAIERGGSSVRDYLRPSGVKGSYQEAHAVYRRLGQPCLACATPIERLVVGGRGTYYCPVCQPAPRRRAAR